MKLKLIGLFVIASLLMVSSLGSGVPAKDNVLAVEEIDDIKDTIPEGFLENEGEGENGTMITTIGPIGSLFAIADINFIDGDPLKILFIELMLQSIPYFLRSYVSLNLNDVTFSIKYTRNIPQLPLIKRFSYETEIDDDGNVSTYTEKHTLIVTGFTGTFGYYHKKPILLYPAYFTFDGSCDEVIVLT